MNNDLHSPIAILCAELETQQNKEIASMIAAILVEIGSVNSKTLTEGQYLIALQHSDKQPLAIQRGIEFISEVFKNQ